MITLISQRSRTPCFHHHKAKLQLLHAFRSLSGRINSNEEISNVLKALQELDTSSLCDADKSLLNSSQTARDGHHHEGLRLLQGGLRPLNHTNTNMTMVGIARTIQATKKDDFLCVLRGLDESKAGEVLVVNTLSSSRAVAGELFTCEAQRRGLSGIIIDGPVRDTMHLNNYNVRMYATSVSPYSGTIQSVGRMQEVVNCGGVQIEPGDILVGDSDGIVAGSLESFQNVLPIAQNIQSIEDKLRDEIASGSSLASMTNLQEHLRRRLEGDESSLEFRFK